MLEMSVQEIHNYLQDSEKKPVLLDVRENWEYDICHIEGSMLMPMQTVPQQLQQLDPHQETIVICHHGIRSRMVGQYLEQADFKNIINLSGGVNAWAQQIDLNMPSY